MTFADLAVGDFFVRNSNAARLLIKAGDKQCYDSTDKKKQVKKIPPSTKVCRAHVNYRDGTYTVSKFDC